VTAEGHTVLIVEDSEVIRTLLEERDYTVVEAADGLLGLDAAREHQPDVVLMDVEMPNMDGYEALAAMKREPELAGIPVVFLTARSEPEEMVLALEAGGHDYLKKPFESPELMARIQAALRARKLQNELRDLNRVLEVQAATDSLTGLCNRRAIDGQLARALAAATRHGRAIAVLMLDLDHFKQINDVHGHHAGDEVLAAVADRLRARTRTEDTLGRWGGEEFMIITDQTDADGAAVLAEELRAAIAGEPILLDGESIDITASVGWALWNGDTEEELVRRADRALYAAKDAGRNSVHEG
jgi:two-component system cell cycle response regulator